MTADEVAGGRAPCLRVAGAIVLIVARGTRAWGIARLARFELAVTAPGAVRIGHRGATDRAAVVATHAGTNGARIDTLPLAECPLQRADRAGLVRALRGAARAFANLARLEHPVSANRRAVVVVHGVAPVGTAAVVVHARSLGTRRLTLGLARAPVRERAKRAYDLRAGHHARGQWVAGLADIDDAVAARANAVDVARRGRRVATRRTATVARGAAAGKLRGRASRIARCRRARERLHFPTLARRAPRRTRSRGIARLARGGIDGPVPASRAVQIVLRGASNRTAPILAPVEQVFGVCWQTRLHVAALPVCGSSVQSFWSSHTGHDPGGSHVSPGSRRPFPQPPQSVSVSALHAAGQQPSFTLPLHTAVAQAAASPPGPSTPASSGASGPTRPYVDRCVVCAVTVPRAALTFVGSRVHVEPVATPRRTSAGETGEMSAGW